MRVKPNSEKRQDQNNLTCVQLLTGAHLVREAQEVCEAPELKLFSQIASFLLPSGIKRVPPICSKFVPQTGCRSDLDSPHGQKGAVRGKPVALPAQTPERGGAHDAQGLLLGRVGQDCCRNEHEGDRRADGHARRAARKDYLPKSACRIPNTPANVRSHFSFTMGPQCPYALRGFRQRCLRVSRNCKNLPGILPRSRKRCKHRHQDRPHTPSPRWTSSVRVDEDPRAPSDWQFRHWRACAPRQSKPLPRCLHWTQRPWSIPQSQVCSSLAAAQPGLRSGGYDESYAW